MSKFEPIKKGFDPRKSSTGGGNAFFKLGAGDTADVVILSGANDILSCEQCAIWIDDPDVMSPVWVYTGGDDPSNELGIPRGYRAYIAILHDGEPKIWSLSKTVHNQLLDISDAGALEPGAMVRVKRTGAGLKTRYSVVPRGKSKDVEDVDVPDILEALGPLTSEGVWDMLTERLGMTREDVIARYGKKKKSRTELAEEEDDSLDEIDADDIDI